MTIKEKELKPRKSGFVSWAIFLVTLTVVLITLTSAVFPALVMGSLDGIKYPVTINIFETGEWTYPLLVTSFIFLGIGMAYFKNKLPHPLKKSIKFIFNFEISAKQAFLVIIILLGIYFTFSIGEIFTDDPWEDFNRVTKPKLEKWTAQKIIDAPLKRNIVFFLGNISMEAFGTYRGIPFIASIALLVLTYFVTLEISKKRFAGIVAMVIVLQSGIFLTYDTTITYPNFWVLFYLLSLYLIYKKWPLSPISYILSLLSKTWIAILLPISLFFIYLADIPRKKKIYLAISYVVIAALGIIGFFNTKINLKLVEFNYHEFWSGFTAFSYQFRFDGLVLMFLLPLTIGLFMASRRGIVNADLIMILIMGMLLSSAVLSGFTDYTNNPYRFILLVVFFAMGVGTILSKKNVKVPA